MRPGPARNLALVIYSLFGVSVGVFFMGWTLDHAVMHYLRFLLLHAKTFYVGAEHGTFYAVFFT
jgi:hypothetical protein